MSGRYRPLPCNGIAPGVGHELCDGCLRFLPDTPPDTLRIRPEVANGACADRIAGAPPVQLARSAG